MLHRLLITAARTSSRSIFTKPNSSVYVSSYRTLSDKKESAGPLSQKQSTASGPARSHLRSGLVVLGFGGLASAFWYASDTTLLKGGGRGGGFGGGRSSFSGFGGRSGGFGSSSGYGRSSGAGGSGSSGSGSSGSRPSSSAGSSGDSGGSSKPPGSASAGAASAGSASSGSASAGAASSGSASAGSTSSGSQTHTTHHTSSSWGPPIWWWWWPPCHHHHNCNCEHKHEKSPDSKPVDKDATKPTEANESPSWKATWREEDVEGGKKADKVYSRRIELPNITGSPQLEEICDELRSHGIRVEKEDWPSNAYVFSREGDVDHKVDKKLNDSVEKLLELEKAASDPSKLLRYQG